MDIELTIRMSQKGEIQVGGPIENKILCLGLMELAKKVIINYEPSKIQIAKTLLPQGQP